MLILAQALQSWHLCKNKIHRIFAEFGLCYQTSQVEQLQGHSGLVLMVHSPSRNAVSIALL